MCKEEGTSSHRRKPFKDDFGSLLIMVPHKGAL